MIETDEDFDPDARQLCPDGNCTGVLGADGRCKACGLDAAGRPVEPAPAVAVAAGGEETFDADRRLCPDGACIGLLGPDGRCKVCGRTAAS